MPAEYSHYKIFFNNKEILICRTIQEGEKGNIYDFRNKLPENLCGIFHMYINNDDDSGLIFLTNDPQKFFREFASNFNIVQAAGGVVKNLHGQLLIIYRLKKWDLPKGKLEKGENPVEGARREVTEECGIKRLKVITSLPHTYHIYSTDGENWILKRTHWFAMISDDNTALKAQTEEGIEKVCWIDSSGLPMVLSNTYPSLKDLFIGAFEGA